MNYNVILNSDMTLKNMVSVDETTARDPSCPIDILDTDIFVEDAPPIPDGIHTPMLLVDWEVMLQADPAAMVWVEANQAEADKAALDAAKKKQKAIIRTAFEISANAPVTVAGVTYNGGYDSALKLDGAKRLAELTGHTSVTFYDIGNFSHILTIAEANDVITSIATSYQSSLSKKQSKLVYINAATTIADVEAAIWG